MHSSNWLHAPAISHSLTSMNSYIISSALPEMPMQIFIFSKFRREKKKRDFHYSSSVKTEDWQKMKIQERTFTPSTNWFVANWTIDACTFTSLRIHQFTFGTLLWIATVTTLRVTTLIQRSTIMRTKIAFVHICRNSLSWLLEHLPFVLTKWYYKNLNLIFVRINRMGK